jgi:hypothetical protein
MSDEIPNENPALRAELVKKAKKAGVAVTKDMTIDDLETAIGDAVLEAPEVEKVVVTDADTDVVTVRITKHGHGKVFKGNGRETYDMDEMVRLPRSVGLDLESRAFGEIR